MIQMYRAKAIETGEWIIGYIFRGYRDKDVKEKVFIVPENYIETYSVDEDTDHLTMKVVEVDKATICENSSIVDRLNDDIYEWDIVKCVTGSKGLYLVRYGDYSFCGGDYFGWYLEGRDSTMGMPFTRPITSEYYIIGNVFDNEDVANQLCLGDLSEEYLCERNNIDYRFFMI